MATIKDLEAETAPSRNHEKFQRILDAALQVFAKKGFHTTKISDIAKIAHVADGTIYLYFKNKDDLMASLFASKLEPMTKQRRAESCAIDSNLDKLLHLVDFHLRTARDLSDLLLILRMGKQQPETAWGKQAQVRVEAYIDDWVDVLRDGQKSGEFSSDFDPYWLGHMLFGALEHTCTIWVLDPEKCVERLRVLNQQMQGWIKRIMTVES